MGFPRALSAKASFIKRVDVNRPPFDVPEPFARSKPMSGSLNPVELSIWLGHAENGSYHLIRLRSQIIHAYTQTMQRFLTLAPIRLSKADELGHPHVPGLLGMIGMIGMIVERATILCQNALTNQAEKNEMKAERYVSVPK